MKKKSRINLNGNIIAKVTEGTKVLPENKNDVAEEQLKEIKNTETPKEHSESAQPEEVAQHQDTGSGASELYAFADTTAAVGKSEPVESEDDDNDRGGFLWLLGGVALAGGLLAINRGHDDSSGNKSNDTSVEVTGTVSDGPIHGALLYVDENGNGVYDAGERPFLDANGNQVTTDSSGVFSFITNENLSTLKLVAHGGIDTTTGEATNLDFTAPVGYRVLNPITSTIAALMEANPGMTAAEAEAKVEAELGLPDLDYSTVDISQPGSNLEAQKAAVILATAAIAVTQSGVTTDAFAYIASKAETGGGSVNSVVQAVLQEPAITGTEVASQLEKTVTAVNAADTLDGVNQGLNDNFFADIIIEGKLEVSEVISGELGMGQTTGFSVSYQWQTSTDGGTTWSNIQGATSGDYTITTGNADSYLRLVATYTGTTGESKTVTSDTLGPVSLTADTTAPDALTFALANDTGVSATDGITDDATVNITGIEQGATWQYSLNGGTTWNAGTGTSFELADNTAYAAGSIAVRQTDAAGNVSVATSNTAVITITPTTTDTSVATPTFALANDTGVSNTDGITTDATVNVSGILSGATWQYSLNGGTTWNTGTGTSFELADATYSAGSVVVRQTDAAGNVSVATSNTSAITITTTTTDTSVELPTFALANDTGVTNTDGITNDATVNVSDILPGATW